MSDEYMTVEEIATTLRLSRMTVYRLVNVGELPAIQIGRSLRVKRTDYDAYVRDAALQTTRGSK